MTIPDESLFVKKSKIPGAGKGLFTRVDIPKGKLVTEYKGVLRTWKEVEDDVSNDYIFYINSKNVIDGRPSVDTFGRFANDGEGKKKIPGVKNNARYKTMGKRVFIEATRNIAPGEEILVSYGKDYWDQEKVNNG